MTQLAGAVQRVRAATWEKLTATGEARLGGATSKKIVRAAVGDRGPAAATNSPSGRRDDLNKDVFDC